MPINHETPPRYEDLDSIDPEGLRGLDLQENEESRPPEGEQVRWPVLMVAECFVGGDLQGLVDGCRDLGMPNEEKTGRGLDFYSWARQVRRTSGAGGWVNIGSGHQALRERESLDDVPVDLPADFNRVHLKAFSPTPSVVILVATFELTAESVLLLDDELRTDRFMKLEKRGSATLFDSAMQRKGKALRAERERVRASASTWIAQAFAGTLSKDFKMTSLPCIEFIAARLRAPFVQHQDDRGAVGNYRHLLSIDSEAEAWECDDVPGWRIGMPWRPTDGEWAIVAGCLHDSQASQNGGSEDQQPVTTPPVTDTRGLRNYFDGLLVRFAGSCLVVQYEIEFGGMRDELASTPKAGEPALRQLDAARETLATLSFDASLVANEFRSWASDGRRWNQDTIEPTTAAEWKRKDYPDHPTLTTIFAEDTAQVCEWLLDLEPRIREQLMTRSSLMATAADLRLQRIVLTISLVALTVALISLVLT